MDKASVKYSWCYGGRHADRRLGAFMCAWDFWVSRWVCRKARVKLLADLVDKHELGEYSFVYALSDIADSLGLVLGPIIGLWLGQVFSYSIGVLSMGMLCLLVAPFVMRIKY